jgi:ABC-type phosphate/phosphonate transport system substrate-binding protein
MTQTDIFAPPRKLIAAAAVLLFQVTSVQAEGQSKDLMFGVFPYLPVDAMERIFAPIAARFSELTGRPVSLRSRPDYERFREQVRQQTYDIVFIQPFDYVSVAADSGYLPVARWVSSSDPADEGNLCALIVARNDSGINTLEDLRGRTVAVPNMDAAVSLLGRDALARRNILVRTNAAGNHLACLQQVQVKHAEACITAWPPVKVFEAKNGVELKVIHTTEVIPSSLFAVHRRIPKQMRDRIRDELLSWHAGAPYAGAFLERGGWTRLSPAGDEDYNIVRDIWNRLGHKDL